MLIRRTLLITALCASLGSGCTTATRTSASRAVGDIAASAGGAAVGYALSDGNAGATLGGAAAAFVVKRYADNVRDKDEQKRLQSAYDTAHAQATRELYDATQRLQAVSTAAPADEAREPVYLPTQIPERRINGVIIDPTIEYIRISDNAAK